MKKIISLLLVLVLALSLCACGSSESAAPAAPEPKIEGTYETIIEMRQLVVDAFDEGTGVEGLSLNDYLDDFSIAMISVFNADGTYSQTIDEASVLTALDNMKAAATPFMMDFMVVEFEKQLNVSGKDAIESAIGMSIEDAFVLTIGMDMETFINQLIDESMDVDTLLADSLTSGNYKAADGKLHLSQSLDEQPSEDAYETYTIVGDTVTITGGVGVEEEELMPYPFTMVKIA